MSNKKRETNVNTVSGENICLTSLTRAKPKDKMEFPRLISTLCVNCLSSIPEYSRLNHLDEYLV